MKLLRKLEVRPAREQGDDQVVQADALALGDRRQVGVEVRAEPGRDVAFVGVSGHLRDDTASGSMALRQIGLATRQRPALYSRSYVL